MRTLTASHLAAQRLSTQSPRVRLVVRDKQPRFSVIGTAGPADVQCSECAVASGSLLIAALDTSGCIRLRQVTAPTSLDPTGDPAVGWGLYPAGYTVLVAADGALARPNGDLCLSNHSGTLRLAYVKPDGTELLERTSTDGGQTWSAPSTVRAVPGGAPGCRYHLAAGGKDDLWYTLQRSGYRYICVGYYTGGTWGSWTTVHSLMETGGEYENCYGLSVIWSASLSRYLVAASLDRASNGDGRIVTARWDPATATLSHYQGIVPPGLPAVGSTARAPCLFQASGALGSLYWLTYWECLSSGQSSWTTPTALFSCDFEHWSFKIPLAFTPAAHERRLAITQTGATVYLHALNEALRLDLWYDGKPDAELTVAQGDILRLRLRESPTSGDTHIELDNRAGRYDTAPALRPLARVSVELGLRTAAGDERVESRPFFLWEQSRVAAEGVNLLRLHAVDGWRLFQLWRPDCTIQWQGHTLGWCIAELASRVGGLAVEFDVSSVWGQTLTYLTVAARYNDWSNLTYVRAWGRWVPLEEPTVMLGQEYSGLALLQRLLGLVGGQARWGHGDQRDVLYCFVPSEQGQAPAAVHTYQNGELLFLQHIQSFAWPTRVRVVGADRTIERQNVPAGLEAGMDFLQMVQASQWATNAQLEKTSDGALDDAAARANGGWFRTRPNAGLELFDVVALTESRAGAGLSAIRRRVTEIETRYEPGRGVWQQEVRFEGP